MGVGTILVHNILVFQYQELGQVKFYNFEM